MDNETEVTADLLDLTSDIVSAYVAKNSVPVSDLPGFIGTIHAALSSLGAPVATVEKPVPLMPIRKTVTPDHIISLEDGKPYKSLKRHLSTRGLTPEQYRQKWGLPHDYPMVAAAYAAQRSELAKSLGLGHNRHDRREGAAAAAPKPTRRGKRATA